MSYPMDAGAGPDSSGDSQSYDGSPVDNQSPSGPESGGQQASTGINPAWSKALEGVPNEFHRGLQEHFGRWDQNYTKLAQQFSPYRNFAEQKIDPDQLQQAWQLRGLLDSNPHEVLRRLSTALGVQIAQEQQEQKQQQQQESSQEFEGDPEDPRWAEMNRRQEMLDQQNQQLMNFLQQKSHQDEVSAAEAEVGQEIDALRQRYGDFDVVDVLQRASLMEEPNIEHAFQQQQEFLQREFQRSRSSANNRAPLVSPTNGGMPPSAEKNPAQYTKAERAAAFGALLQAHAQQ